MTRRRPLMFALILALLPLATGAGVARAEAPGQTLLDQVKQAYADLDHYDARVDFRVEQKTGRWLNTQATWYRIAFDRPTGRLLIDQSDFKLTADKSNLRMTSDQLSGVYLDATPPDPLTLQGLITAVPPLIKPMLVDAAFLLESDPIALITGGGTSLATPLGVDPNDPRQRPRLEVGTAEGQLVLSIDPQSKLITQAVFNLNYQGDNAGDYARLIYEFTFAKDKPDDAAFAMNVQNLHPVDTFEQLTQTASGSGPGSAPGSGGAVAGAGNNASGNETSGAGGPAPAIKSFWLESAQAELKPFELKDVKEPIVVLHFWASWLRDAYESVPKMQELREWTAKEKLPVAVLTVNMGDQSQEVQRFLRTARKEGVVNVPVVLDRDYKIGEAYQATTPPLTVIIVNGEIRHALSGYSPNFEDVIKAAITQSVQELKDKEAKEAEADKPAEQPAEAAQPASP